MGLLERFSCIILISFTIPLLLFIYAYFLGALELLW
jgi:hypothetical protein